jgi:predicted RNA-binding Zn ribbon-like protein
MGEVSAMNETSILEGQFSFVAEDLSLDFANTMDGYRGGGERELLNSYGDLLVWAREAGILTEAETQELFRASQEDPTAASVVLARAIRLREALYRLIAAHLHDQAPQPGDLGTLNAELAQTMAHREVHGEASHYVWGWKRPLGRFDGLLWPVVAAAAELLVTLDHTPVRECASDTCTWLFLDTTRNHSRQWCTMRGCGNRAKVRRYRQKAAQSAQEAANE